jgi:putative restriction endonuclease
VSHEKRIWSFAISSEPIYGGNTGYDDDVERVYRYDSLVQYHAQVRRGELAIVVVDDDAVGIARIEQIETSPGTKQLRKCPGCKTTDIRRRKTVDPPFRCQRCGGQFTHPKDDEVDVTLYTARFRDWSPLRGVTRAEVRRSALKRGMTAIRPLDPDRVRSMLRNKGPVIPLI